MHWGCWGLPTASGRWGHLGAPWGTLEALWGVLAAPGPNSPQALSGGFPERQAGGGCWGTLAALGGSLGPRPQQPPSPYLGLLTVSGRWGLAPNSPQVDPIRWDFLGTFGRRGVWALALALKAWLV